MSNDKLPLGTEVLFIHDQDGLAPGSRGVIKGYQNNGYNSFLYSVYVTHPATADWSGHRAGNESGVDYRHPDIPSILMGWNVNPKNVKKFYDEIEYDPKQMMDQEDDI